MTTHTGLSLAQAPPISVPMRFFLTAPLFGLLAAMTLVGAGDVAMTRWTPATLAITHLMTLGYISMVMMGAMSQMLPVLVGSPMPRPVVISSVVHTLLTVGVLALATGLLLERGEPLQLALWLLGLAFSVFMLVAAYSLVHAQTNNATVSGMRLAIVALLITVVLGLRLAAEHIWLMEPALTKSWTDIHLAWGLLGWVGILVIGVAYEVVPMFQMTPHYPPWIKRWLVKLMLATLVLWSCLYAVPLFEGALKVYLTELVSLFLALGLALFVGWTLFLQSRRRRRLSDVTLQFWRLAMISLLSCILLWIAALLWPVVGDWQGYDYLLGLLLVVGFTVSVINGMLYKIIPFLVWLHLQGQSRGRYRLPNMKEIIPDGRALQHLRLYAVSLLLLVCAVIEPAWFIYPAAMLFALSCLMHFFNIYMALRLYRDVSYRLSLAE